MSNNYDFKNIEKEAKTYWTHHEENNIDPALPTFSIVLPPPNVTGHLHLGHMWDGILQDAVIRYKKLQGFKTLWIPGTDHAGIATQVKFENYLKSKNINKDDLTKTEFLKQLNIWKDEQIKYIHEQWNEMGFLLDYKLEKFTLDASFSNAVANSFIKLYNDGLIYEDYKLVNWDPVLKTAISDIEVITKATPNKLYYIKYELADKTGKKIFLNEKDSSILIATSRPETMFGDVAICYNENDARYKKLDGLCAICPITNKLLPILASNKVDANFGSGLLKITPSCDFSDCEIAKELNLPTIKIFNDDATLNNEIGQEFAGLDIITARNKIIELLKNKNLLHHIEDIISNIGYSERTNAIILPHLTKQWFLKTSLMAKKVIALQGQSSNSKKAVSFLPARFNETLIHWLENMQDWCISRQLTWGHQVFIWKNEKGEVVCSKNVPGKNWTRSNDVLDTWYSSGLWPMIALGWDGKSKTITNKAFPTQLLVTGYDIVFFWIARMMMFSSYFLNTFPFENVYIHGLVRDSQNRKMSKSLGNGIEPKELISEFGNDSVRIFFLSSSISGQDINFSKDKLYEGSNFLIKVWNISRFIENKQWTYKEEINKDLLLTAISSFMLNKLKNTKTEYEKFLNKYDFGLAFKTLKDFIYDDFASFYLEYLKKAEEKSLLNKNDFLNDVSVFMLIWREILLMLHPFACFLSQYLYTKQIKNESIFKAKRIHLQEITKNNNHLFTTIETALTLLKDIRNIKQELNLTNKEELFLAYSKEKNESTYNNQESTLQITIFNNILALANSSIILSNNPFLTDTSNFQPHYLAIRGFVFCIYLPKSNIEASLNKTKQRIEQLENEVNRSKKILSNQNFINKAKPEKITEEKDKLAKYEQELSELKDKLTMTELNKQKSKRS